MKKRNHPLLLYLTHWMTEMLQEPHWMSWEFTIVQVRRLCHSDFREISTGVFPCLTRMMLRDLLSGYGLNRSGLRFHSQEHILMKRDVTGTSGRSGGLTRMHAYISLSARIISISTGLPRWQCLRQLT